MEYLVIAVVAYMVLKPVLIGLVRYLAEQDDYDIYL